MPFEKCPCCFDENSERVRFTLWGGAIGPAVLSLVKCAACGIQYNGRSGNRVEKAIRVYTALMLCVLIVLAAGVFYAYAGGPVVNGEI